MSAKTWRTEHERSAEKQEPKARGTVKKRDVGLKTTAKHFKYKIRFTNTPNRCK